MVPVFHDDLMGAEGVHLVVETLSLLALTHFKAKGRIGGRETSHEPFLFTVKDLSDVRRG